MANTPPDLAQLEQQLMAVQQQLQLACRQWGEFLADHSAQVQASVDMFLQATPAEQQLLRDFVVAQLPPEQAADALAFMDAPPADIAQLSQLSQLSHSRPSASSEPTARFPHARIAGRI